MESNQNNSRESVKEVYAFKRQVDINEMTELVIKIDLNSTTGTFAIKPKITTNHIDLNDPYKVLPAFNSLLEETIKFANEQRRKILEGQEREKHPGQLRIDYQE